VFAVGYAAQQISSGAQLQRLMSNPPLAFGLQQPPVDWSMTRSDVGRGPCRVCGKQTKELGKVNSIDVFDFEFVVDFDVIGLLIDFCILFSIVLVVCGLCFDFACFFDLS
jgi:hypothetical protein